MDRDTLRAKAQALLEACTALQAIFRQVHDLGGVRMPSVRHQTSLELFEGWTHTDMWRQIPAFHLDWPPTAQASHHRKLAVAAVGRVWETETPKAMQAVVRCGEALLEATFPEGVPEGSVHGQSCGIDIHVGPILMCYVGWASATSETATFGLEGYGLDLENEVDALVDALLIARHLSQAPTPVDAPFWTVDTTVGCKGLPNSCHDKQTLQALDPADALARVALTGANAVLCAARLRTLAVSQKHTVDADHLLSTIRTRALPCTSNANSTPT